MTDKPTATEFIPSGQNGYRDGSGPGIRRLQATGDGGVEPVTEEPFDGPVRNRVYLCDLCGHYEPTEDGIAHHLHYQHEVEP